MTEYKMITPDQAPDKGKLIALYNDAVETIWQLQQKCAELSEDYDNLFYDYEQVSDQLYG